MHGARLDPRPRLLGAGAAPPSGGFRFDEALVTQLVLARRRAALRAARRPGPRRRRRAARRLRRAAAVHADRRASSEVCGRDRGRPRPAPPDEPAAPGRGRLRQDRWSRCGRCSGSSTPAARPRCWRPPRCSPSSTTGRSPPCSATSPPAACSAAPPRRPGSCCSPARCPRRPGTEAMLGAASGEAGIVIGTHALLQEHVSSSPTSGSSSSTSSTGSASSSVPPSPTRPAPRPTSW